MGAILALSDLLHEMLHDEKATESKAFYRRPDAGNRGISINVTYVCVVSSDTRPPLPKLASIEHSGIQQALDALLRSLDLSTDAGSLKVRQIKMPSRRIRRSISRLNAAMSNNL